MNNEKLCPQCGRSYGNEDRFCTVDGASLVASGTGSLIGTVVADRFLVHEKLGEGGMGEVYLAEHVRIRRKVALKLMRPWMIGDPVALGRFHREAENASQISHPNVAQVYDFGETPDKLVYLAMEFVDGESLSRILEREKSLHLARTAEVTRQIAEALTAAHTMGILHRDLKPDNVMIGRTRYGTDLVKLVDFGIARAMNRTTQQFTSTGLIIGTPDYMSPEQLSGDALDERSDLYALALIAYKALTGTAAYPEGASGEALIARMTSPPRRLADSGSEVEWPDSLQSAFDRALAADPNDRYSDPLEFVAELDAVVTQMPLGEEEQAYLLALSQRTPTPARGGIALDSGHGIRAISPPPTEAPIPVSQTQRRSAVPFVPATVIGEGASATADVAVQTEESVEGGEAESLKVESDHSTRQFFGGRRLQLLLGGVVAAAAVAVLVPVLSKDSDDPASASSLSAAVPADSSASFADVVSGVGVLLASKPEGVIPDSILVPAVSRATVAISSSAGSGSATIVDRSGLALTAASLIPRDSVVDVFPAPNRRARATVMTIDQASGLATLLIPMRHCVRCEPVSTSVAGATVGDSVVMIPPLRRGDGAAVHGKVTELGAERLGTSLTLRRAQSSAPVVSAQSGELLGLALGNRVSTTTMLQDAVVKAKALPARVANDSLFPTWPDTPMPTSRLGAQAIANTRATIASYQLPGEDITVLVMTPQVMKYRSRLAEPNPMAIRAPTRDPIMAWSEWDRYVDERRAVVMLDAAGNSASFPFSAASDRRGDVREVRLFRDDVLVMPIETSRYASVRGDGAGSNVPSSSVAVYSPYDFEPGARYRVEVVHAGGTARYDVKIGTLEAIRKDLDVVLR